ncbi:5-methyltetrahydrofolate--homocysteine methyltransferase [Dethiosulfatibacter aminovorans DSM 17477]|uniref:5-methyltetrahydrofolate--homocysteine methyltransferase n=1 Tax=Dethiosulfatibacter aminovorans DSM 17477 TaxID=1121476 RepID=A0A1M6K8N9_9FIRM|nr:corrinoid protein [Dethiosulfatibacter aminovorans]SHJ55309.1 5-methyltetrahydrofolate--homocysteine methyltransferase [Dethiosulfatibacter aminovorans DSM 17477]
MNNTIMQLSEAIIDGNIMEAKILTQKALDMGATAKQILDEGLMNGMNEVGELFRDGELFVPEVLVASKAMDTGMEIIKPFLKEGDVEKKGKCVFATVKGDLHDIGKKLVAMMMEGAGYEIVDLGVDVSPEQLVDAVKEHEPELLGMSAMLTTTMAYMNDTVKALEENGLLDKVGVMIGGAPVSPKYASEINAKYSADASSAVELANSLISL